MLPKQRVKAAIERTSADRVAIDFSGRNEVISSLLDRLRLPDHSSLLDALGVDLRFVEPRFVVSSAADLHYADPTVEVTPQGIHRDIWGVGFTPNQTENGFYMDLADHPLRDVTAPESLDSYPWPSPRMWDYTTIKEQAEQVSDYWVWAHSRGVFEISWFLRGFENFMLDLETNEVLACAIMDRIETYLYERTRHILEAADGLIDMVEYNDDVGGQYGMLISPKCFRKHLKPRMKRFVDLCKNHGAVVRYHSCGSIRAILEDCIEIGIDVINPVQTGAAEMDPENLKRDFGPRITFNGGIDTEELLPRASYQEVRDEVARLIGIFGKGGGYILSPSHAFQADVPVENVLAVYETALGKHLL